MPRSFADLKAIRVERRAASMRGQELAQPLRDVHARDEFDPNQLWVLPGTPAGATWEASTPPISPRGPFTFPLTQLDDTSDGRSSSLLGPTLLPSMGSGILGNLGQSIDSWNSSSPSWSNSAMPPSTNGGIFGGALLLPALPHSLPLASGNTASSWPAALGENVGSSNVPVQQGHGAFSSMYGAPASASRPVPSGIQLAQMDAPIPGIRPPIPPVVVPGLPEWSDHFTRGLQGLINAFKSSGRRGARRGNDDYCYDRLQDEERRCYERSNDYAHGDYLAACKERAKKRWEMCIANNGRPNPNEPKEWGPDDEEIWIDPSR